MYFVLDLKKNLLFLVLTLKGVLVMKTILIAALLVLGCHASFASGGSGGQEGTGGSKLIKFPAAHGSATLGGGVEGT